MNTTRILISNEFESYREALAEAFRAVYPELEVFEVERCDLDRKVDRLRPELVVCSHATALVRRNVPVWVELYPDCSPLSVISVAGRRREAEGIELQELLDLADQADAARMKREGKARHSKPHRSPGPTEGASVS